MDECKICYSNTNLMNVCKCIGTMKHICSECFIEILKNEIIKVGSGRIDLTTNPITIYLNTDQTNFSIFKCKICNNNYDITYIFEIIHTNTLYDRLARNIYIFYFLMIIDLINILLLSFVYIDTYRNSITGATSIIVYILDLLLSAYIMGPESAINYYIIDKICIIGVKFISLVIMPVSYCICMFFNIIDHNIFLTYNPIAVFLGINYLTIFVAAIMVKIINCVVKITTN